MSNYRKLAVALGGLAAAVGVVLADGAIDPAEWGFLAGAVATAIGVYFAKNDPVSVPETD